MERCGVEGLEGKRRWKGRRGTKAGEAKEEIRKGEEEVKDKWRGASGIERGRKRRGEASAKKIGREDGLGGDDRSGGRENGSWRNVVVVEGWN